MGDETAVGLPEDEQYDALLADLRAIILQGRGRAATAVQTGPWPRGNSGADGDRGDVLAGG